jgi:hypothetical protein
VSLFGNQHLRSLLWMFAAFGPVVAVGLVALCCCRRTRRAAIRSFAFACALAAVATTWFHFAYVVPIWAGHSSAICLLDRGAFSAAFAIAVCGGGIAALGCRIWRRPEAVD